MMDQRYIYYTKEVALMIGLSEKETRGVAKLFGVRQEFGVWKFTIKDVEKIMAVKNSSQAVVPR